MTTTYTKNDLVENKTVSELKAMVRELKIVGVLKKRKDIMAQAIIDAIAEMKASGIPTVEELNEKTCADLREMCLAKNIPGMSKKRKELIIEALIASYSENKEKSESTPTPKVEDNFVSDNTEILNNGKKILSKVSFEANTHFNNPQGYGNNKGKTTIRVSSGSSSSEIQYAGQTVETILNTFDEIFNIDRSSNILVNGKPANLNTILEAGDNLEFLKAAGRKQ